MEIDGKEFMRNVGLEQDKDKLMEEQKRLEALKRDSIKRDETYANNNFHEDESAYIDLSLNNMQAQMPIEDQNESINNIILNQDELNKNKKRYIVLGISLILLFLITILVFRLISNSDVQDNMENINPNTKELTRDKILNKIDTNEEYQKVIDRKSDLEISNNMDKKEKLKEIIIPNDTSNNTPIVIDTPKQIVEPKRDLFGLNNNPTKQLPTKIVQNTNAKTTQKVKPKVKQKVVTKSKMLSAPKRIISIKPPEETNFEKKVKLVSGYYIQIGAFTKKPSDKLLNNIANKGYSYTVHTMIIKGTRYNKVLIGSYPSRAKATNALNKVKKVFNNKNAYILKF